MPAASVRFDEAARLRLLADYGVMDTGPDEALDEIVALASAICETPIALISLVDETRQWFKAKVGLAAQEMPREDAFCAHAIVADDVQLFTVEDARVDARFEDNPLVTGDPKVVFYAGAPLAVEGGAKLGTLCVIDRKPRALTDVQKQALETLSGLVVRHLQQRREHADRVAAEAWRHAVLTSIGDALISTDGAGRVTFLNPVAARLTGWGAVEAAGVPIEEVLPLIDEATRAPMENPVPRAIREASEVRVVQPTLLVRRDGREIPIEENAAPVRNARGEATGAVLVFRDVTEQRALMFARTKLAAEQREAREAAERATHTMDQFLATVSHELRTPLNAMLGWTRLLRNGQVSEEQWPKALATIERNAVAQAQLIGDLLDVSRIIAGKMRLELEQVDLVAVIEAALDVVRPAAEAKSITLRAELDPEIGPLTADGSRIQQVVWNLLSNAVKFTPIGGQVRIELARGASSIAIAVHDSGEGIAPDFLDHVFERFRQADGAITRHHGGLGLGLAIVKNLVELHGGSIRAESKGLGLGASFVLDLPLGADRPSSTEPMIAAHPMHDDGASYENPIEITGLRILVVEDEEDARELLAAILRECGAIVETGASAAEGLAVFRRASFDVVVSDLGMPGEDGYAFIRKIRQLPSNKGGRVPVIALTAYARAEDRTRTLRAGFSSHVAKPIEPSELLAVIASLVEQASDY